VVGAIGEDSGAVGVDGDGADEGTPQAGAAYVFAREGVTWSQRAYLKASNTDAGDRFGRSCAISYGTIVVGTNHEDSAASGVDGDASDNSASDAGAAYVFVGPQPSAPAFCFGDGTTATPCPCGNVGSPGRGCDNSSGGGGAWLTSQGSAFPDTIRFTSTGELATSSSIFLQGSAPILQGLVFGDGVRCTGGQLLRLYTKSASNGTVSAPSGADPSVSARSAALGDPLAPGSTRYYQVYYRDPVLAFCPAPPGNSWNASNALRIEW
jgi:hypothetical protein